MKKGTKVHIECISSKADIHEIIIQGEGRIEDIILLLLHGMRESADFHHAIEAADEFYHSKYGKETLDAAHIKSVDLQKEEEDIKN